ncbi:MAG: DUF3943 domain-containing protein [Flavobacteriales bacterium]|nr:DUF3943 domain-containing protein [Flavobacteriales bacterium]
MVRILLLYFLTLVVSFGSALGQEIEVVANTYAVPSGLTVKKGETYRISAEGQWQDASFPATDASGFKGFTAPMFFGMLLKPIPGQHYMKLCGKVKNWKFPIGNSSIITMKRTGELQLFANDAKGFFDNNSGSLRVSVVPAQKDSTASFKPRLLEDGTFVPRNAHAPFGRKMWRGGLFVHGIEAISYGILAALPSDISGWKSGTFNNYGSNLKRAWTQPPVLDHDKWFINYIGHPYQGTYFYNAVRSQNATIWQSALFCVGQVFVWEYVIEAGLEQPSIQDLIITPIAGIAFGELIHFGTMKMAKNGLKWYEAIAVTVLNPMFVLNNGYRYRLSSGQPTY